MYSETELSTYAARLYARRGEGVIVQLAEVELGGWQPEERECHANVGTVCTNRPEFTPVRGWLYFNFGDLLPYVRFNAHSIVQLGDGALFDITPSRASQQYPFIRAEESEQKFLDFVLARVDEYTGVSIIEYYVRTGQVRIAR